MAGFGFKKERLMMIFFILLFAYVIPFLISLFFTHDPARSALIQIPFAGPYIAAVKENSIKHSLIGVFMTSIVVFFMTGNLSGGESGILRFFIMVAYFIFVVLFPYVLAVYESEEAEIEADRREVEILEEEEFEEEDDCNTRLKLQEQRLRSELSACPEGQRCTTGGG